MPCAILVVDRPSARDQRASAWDQFLGQTKKLATPNKGVETLGENVWLIALDENVSSFAEIAANAGSFGYQYRVLFLENAPLWCRSSSQASE